MRKSLAGLLFSGLVIVAACAGPENRDDTDPSASMVVQTTAPLAAQATMTMTEAPGATSTPEPTATSTATGTPTSTATPEPPTATPEPTVTPTQLPLSLAESLPRAEELPGGGFFLANQGARSALELANSYADSSAHLERLNNWGFKEHLFREYGRESDGQSLPTYVLTTVNEYGGDDLAAEALEWLRSLNASQGHTFVEPDPELASASFASSVLAADGSQTAIAYVQVGPRIYAYFAQGGEPLDFVLEIATSNTSKILGSN